MDWPDILRRIQEKESDVTDFKRWEAFPGQVGKAVCAMANTRGGVVVLGIDDDGRIAGVAADPDKVQERLTSFLQTSMNAPVSARPGLYRTPAGWVRFCDVMDEALPYPQFYCEEI